MIRYGWLTILSALMFASIGCRNTCGTNGWCRTGAPAQPTFVAPASPTILQPPPQGFAPQPQTQGFPTLPPQPQQQAFPMQPQGQGPPPSITPPGPGGTQSRFEPNWKPTEAREPMRDVPPRIQLYAPESVDKEKPGSTPEPPLNGKPNVTVEVVRQSGANTVAVIGSGNHFISGGIGLGMMSNTDRLHWLGR